MTNLEQKIPTLRITIAFAIGIILANFYSINSPLLLLISVVVVSILVYINRNYSYRLEPVFGWLVYIVFIVLGIIVFQQYNKKPQFFSNGNFAATVLETPEEKPNSYKCIVNLNTLYRNDSVLATHEKILVYFEKSETARDLKPGNTILFLKTPEAVDNNGNPYEFDYKNYLANKKIYRRIYLAEHDWKLTGIRQFSARIIAESTREKLLTIYRNQNLGENETEILSALTLGYKRGLDPETKRIFSAAGAMHVLAVSGLHVGIIFGMFTLLFGFLRKRKFGKYVFILIAVIMLWSYAFITGLSPSVMRAATMFSMVCIAANINRRANIYNSLAASAFLLLIINPNNLFEVGFQLSYAAVFGIVFLQPKLERVWQVQNKVLKFFWTLLTVSIAAQIATFPITSFYFNQFPVYFWLTNLVVIPAAFVLIALGVTLLVFSNLPFLGPFLAFVTKWVIKVVYFFLAWIENLPFAVQEINLTKPELAFLLFAFLSGFMFVNEARIRYMKAMLVSLLLLGFANFGFQLQQLKSTKLIVYNHNPQLIVHLIKGQQNYIVSEDSISEMDYVFREIETVVTKKGLFEPQFLLSNQEFKDKLIFLKNGIIQFEGKTILLDQRSTPLPDFIRPDYFLSSNSFMNLPVDSPQITVITNSYPKITNRANIYFLRQSGAFRSEWP